MGKKRPSHIFGRGLVKLDDIYEFQTAKICEAENWNLYIKDVIEKLSKKYEIVAKQIPTLPDKVNIKDVSSKLTGLDSVPIGISKKTLNVYTYNFKKKLVNIISSKNIDYSVELLSGILEEIKQLDDVKINLFDAELILQTKKTNLNLKFKNLKLGIDNKLNANKYNLCVIIGLEKFLNALDDGEEELKQTLEAAEKSNNYSFVIVDNFTRLKNHEYDDWYKEYVTGDTGIWVGNGISDQYLITVNSSDNDLVNNCGKSFGYAINQETPVAIKLLGMKEKGDENG